MKSLPAIAVSIKTIRGTNVGQILKLLTRNLIYLKKKLLTLLKEFTETGKSVLRYGVAVALEQLLRQKESP